ncbi:MAG: alpha/beta hydrolase [Desulfobacterales bacterium]|nr:alpha/beta hydrolase [Desulfobacterales bacterium]
MKLQKFTFQADDGTKIFYHQWLPEEKESSKAIVQIAHGMAEHSERYSRFAEALTKKGFAVYANDHRGHGQTAGSLENVGYFADENGWNLVIEDMRTLTETIKSNHPNMPIFLFGHSMGSFLSRNYIFHYGNDIQGVILSGTGGDPGLLGKIGNFVAKRESKNKGKKYRSPLLKKLSFGKFNNAFKPNRTDFDWLSRDTAEVDKYVADPYCGGDFTAGFYEDLLSGLAVVNNFKNTLKVPKDLPIYLFSGDKDPVGNNTKGVKQIFIAYQKAGIKDVTCKFYKDGRHEMLNEINREEVFKDIIEWLSSHL